MRETYIRALTACETDVLGVAAELMRTKWADDIPDWLVAQMVGWSLRLKAAHDELCTNLLLHPSVMGKTWEA